MLLIKAFKVVQVRVIFQPLYTASATGSPSDIYFYGESFNFSPLNKAADSNGHEVFAPEPGTDMFVVNRHLRHDRSRVGDIYKLTDVCEFVELVPKFGKSIADDINSNNSLERMSSYYINHFAAKETYHAILSYQ